MPHTTDAQKRVLREEHRPAHFGILFIDLFCMGEEGGSGQFGGQARKIRSRFRIVAGWNFPHFLASILSRPRRALSGDLSINLELVLLPTHFNFFSISIHCPLTPLCLLHFLPKPLRVLRIFSRSLMFKLCVSY